MDTYRISSTLNDLKFFEYKSQIITQILQSANTNFHLLELPSLETWNHIIGNPKIPSLKTMFGGLVPALPLLVFCKKFVLADLFSQGTLLPPPYDIRARGNDASGSNI